jgi:putative DNA primase/helicase
MDQLACRYSAQLSSRHKQRLADKLGLPVNVFVPWLEIGISFNGQPLGPGYTFPEWGTRGDIIGVLLRKPDGTKRMIPRSHRGIHFGGRSVFDDGCPLFLVEGPTDTLAMSAAGLWAVGRPSATGGVDLLAAYLRTLPAEQKAIVVGENDRKSDDTWPGRDGAINIAEKLAQRLGRPIGWTLVPDGAKDVRAWLTARVKPTDEWRGAGRELAAALEAAAETKGEPNLVADDTNDQPVVNEREDDPHRLARVLLSAFDDTNGCTLCFWNGVFYEWRHGRFWQITRDDMTARVTRTVKEEYDRLNAQALHEHNPAANKGRSGPPTARPVHRNIVASVIQALGSMTLVSSDLMPPAWLNGNGPEPTDLMPCENTLVSLPDLITAKPCFYDHSPRFFSLNALNYPFDADAPTPDNWLHFLSELWPGDQSSIECLQEFMGYCLTPDTSQQKIQLIVGPKRSGKGTIARVLEAVVGTHNYVAPTLSSLGTNFGLAPLIGKNVAVISDAKLSGRTDATVVTERLLSISGEDAITIDRKHRDPMTVKLSTRFMILTNELPKFPDGSGALAGRFIVLQLTRSFYDHEDHDLTRKLIAERAGILLWAIEGWKRLRSKGRFTIPPTGRELIATIEKLGSPVRAFVEEKCRFGANVSIEAHELFMAWRGWCDENGVRDPGSIHLFGRDLAAAFPQLLVTRPKVPGPRPRHYRGIALGSAASLTPGRSAMVRGPT